MDGSDMRGDEREHGSQHGCVVGEAKSRYHVGNEVEGQNEVGNRCKKHAAHSHRRCRVKGAVVSGYQVLDERHLPGETPQLSPKVAADLLLPLMEAMQRYLLAERSAPKLPGVIPGNHLSPRHSNDSHSTRDMAPAQGLQAKPTKLADGKTQLLIRQSAEPLIFTRLLRRLLALLRQRTRGDWPFKRWLRLQM